MLRSRLIPCLLVQNEGLVKTQKFDKPKYVGDPLNAVRIFNEKEVDELMVLEIDATTKAKEPNYQLISNLSSECQMPICYGGGIKTIEQIEKIVSLGVEKVAISSAAIENPDLISFAASRIGSQSVVVVIDVKKTGLFKRYEVVTHNGKRRTGSNPLYLAKQMEQLGAGEIVINSIDNDGEMEGYDFDLCDAIWDAMNIPLTILGGVGSMKHIQAAVEKYKIIGTAAGSLFVFKGKYRAVLINYPDKAAKGLFMAHQKQ